MTAPVMRLREAIARWLVDDLPGSAGPHFDELDDDARARWRLAAVDFMEGPLRSVVADGRRVAGIRALHAPLAIYDSCPHAHTEAQVRRGTAVDTGHFLTCVDGWLYSICTHCCTAGPEFDQIEECATWHAHRKGEPVCATSAILDGL